MTNLMILIALWCGQPGTGPYARTVGDIDRCRARIVKHCLKNIKNDESLQEAALCVSREREE